MDEERPPAGQVAVFIDFENLVLGAGKGLPGQATRSRTPPWPACAVSTATPRCGALTPTGPTRGSAALPGRPGAQRGGPDPGRPVRRPGEERRRHPDGRRRDGDADRPPGRDRLRAGHRGQRLHAAGPPAAGVRQVGGRRRHRGRPASRRLSSVCSEYKFWGTLVAEADPAARPAVDAAFDIAAAEQLLVRAFEETARTTLTASAIKSKMVALDSSFDERNYGCRSFRDFLDRFPGRVRRAGRSGSDITLELYQGARRRPGTGGRAARRSGGPPASGDDGRCALARAAARQAPRRRGHPTGTGSPATGRLARPAPARPLRGGTACCRRGGPPAGLPRRQGRSAEMADRLSGFANLSPSMSPANLLANTYSCRQRSPLSVADVQDTAGINLPVDSQTHISVKLIKQSWMAGRTCVTYVNSLSLVRGNVSVQYQVPPPGPARLPAPARPREGVRPGEGRRARRPAGGEGRRGKGGRRRRKGARADGNQFRRGE